MFFTHTNCPRRWEKCTHMGNIIFTSLMGKCLHMVACFSNVTSTRFFTPESYEFKDYRASIFLQKRPCENCKGFRKMSTPGPFFLFSLRQSSLTKLFFCYSYWTQLYLNRSIYMENPFGFVLQLNFDIVFQIITVWKPFPVKMSDCDQTEELLTRLVSKMYRTSYQLDFQQ